MQDKKVILISPNVFSIYSINVLNGLIEKDIHVVAILIVKLFNIKRVVEELKRNRRSLFKRVYGKLLFREKRVLANDGRAEIAKTNLKTMARQHHIPVHFVGSINSHEAEQVLRKNDFDLVVFTGGGIIKSNILQLANDGVVNCHSGMLPYYRGMDCHKWAIINNEPDKVGVSCHFMTEKVDRGRLLSVHPLEIDNDDSLERIEKKMEQLMSVEIVKAVNEYLSGKLSPVEQNIEAGKNYYTMHVTLEAIVRKKLTQLKRSA